MPGVQKPHCRPWFSLKAACMGCKVPSGLATPSMVMMSAPSASQERFDLVILDIGLPQMDGFEVLRRLRAAEKPMPVLVLTARDAVDDRVRGLDLGADDYMAKPFAMPELTARVRALLRRSLAQTGPKVVHGPLTLDTVARRAYLAGEPLELAAREWAVLEVLLGKVEKIVSKESII